MALVKRTGFIRFSRWGAYLGRLNVTAAKHADALDGTDEIKITCKDDVSKGDYIVWFDDKGKAHEHIVDEADRTHGEDGTVSTTFTGVNSIAELWDDWTDDIRPSGTVGVALDRALLGTRWTVGTCDLTTESSVVLYHQSVRESIAEILNAWGGELETEIITNGSCVIERRVGVRAVRGNQSSPKRFTWTKDIKSITRTVSSENPKTRVYGYGRGVETDSGGFGRRLTFESINDGKEYVEDAEATKIWGHPGANGTILPSCTSYINEQCEDEAQLLAETREFAKTAAEPKVSYKARVIDLYAFGRSWEGVGLGDKVAIIDKGFTDDGIRLTGRVSQIERDLISADTTVTFGNLSDSMADMWQSVSQTLRDNTRNSASYDAVASTSVGWLTQLQSALNEQFNAAGTYKVETFELGAVYSNVPLDPETGTPIQHVSSMWAVNISGRGIRLASSLTDAGEWNWKTFITGASVNADCINAGTINGDHIKGGTIEGSVYRYGDDTAYTLINGSRLYTTNGSNSIQIDGYGIRSNYQSGATLSDYTWIGNGGIHAASRKNPIIPDITHNGYVDLGIANITGLDCFSPLFFKNIDTGKSGWGVVSDSANNFNFVWNATSSSYLEFKTMFGTYAVTAWASDRRKKESIETADVDATAVLRRIRHERFRWKDVVDGLGNVHKGAWVDCGYIAQEMQEINPAFVISVAEGTPDEQLQINENALIPYITKSLQEMDARIAALENAMQEKGA
ncbi:phage tail spike protein [Adlercreutzia rubneri]